MNFKKTSEYSQKLSASDSYVWIKKIKQESKIKCDEFSFTLFPIFLLFTMCYLLSLIWLDLPFWLPVIFLPVIIFAEFYTEKKLREIECPKCGYKPSKNRKGEEIAPDILNDRLLKLTDCPKCEKSKARN